VRDLKMFGRLPLVLFCSWKILLDEYLGHPHPGAWCLSPCVCLSTHPSIHVCCGNGMWVKTRVKSEEAHPDTASGWPRSRH
jgi:hypothetical protein